VTADTALARYPELQSLGETVIVPPARLQTFVANASAHPPNGLSHPQPFALAPSALGFISCLPLVGVNRGVTTGVPQLMTDAQALRGREY